MRISRPTHRESRSPESSSRRHAAFTLIELILVMTILTVTISLIAPALANFFRGRSLDSEARRLLALTRQGQARAISEGIPMELWIDAKENLCGLEAEPSYEQEDPRAVQFALDPGLQVDFANVQSLLSSDSLSSTPLSNSRSGQTVRTVLSRHPDLPRIRFLPSGALDEKSPQAIVLTGRDGHSMAIKQSQNGLSYEIGAKPQ